MNEQVERQPLGVIDAISLGYRLVLRHWGIVLVPLLMDIFFWLGPQVTPWAAMRTLMAQSLPELRTALEQSLGLTQADLIDPPTGANVLTLLVRVPGSPSTLAATLGSLPAPPGWTQAVYSPESPWVVVGLMVALLFLGTPIAGLYLTLAARIIVLPEHRQHGLLSTWAWTTVHLFLLVLLALVAFIGVTVGISLLLLLGLFVSQGVAVALLGVSMFILSWLMVVALVLFYFAPASIVLHRANVFQALMRSAVIVARNLWSSLGLIAVTFIISEGFALIWLRLFSSTAGAALSLVGNAYLTTGLTLAALLFFQDRYYFWYQAMAKALD